MLLKTLFRVHAVGSVLAVVVTAGIGCKSKSEPSAPPQKGAPAMTLTVQTSAFQAGQAIPKRHTGDAEDVSVPLTFGAIPDSTRELALIVDDPDAPTPTPWVHWVIYKIPASTTSLPEGVPKGPTPSTPQGAMQGKNSWGSLGYRGPAPPEGHGTHHYHFKLYALDTELDVEPGLDKDGLLSAMGGHVIAQGELVGTYER